MKKGIIPRLDIRLYNLALLLGLKNSTMLHVETEKLKLLYVSFFDQFLNLG